MTDQKHELQEVDKNRQIGSFYTSLQNFEDGQRVANLLAQSDFIPDQYKGNIPNCMVAMEMASRQGISPLTVMQNLNVIKGNPSWKSPFIISLVNACGLYERLRLVISEDKQTCFAWTVELETREKKIGTTITMAMARAEGWTKNKKWETMPEQMLKYRAAAFFAREHCPEVLNGLYTVDEVQTFDDKKSPLENMPDVDNIQYNTIEDPFPSEEDIPEVVVETVESDIIDNKEAVNMFEQKAKEVQVDDDEDDGPGF